MKSAIAFVILAVFGCLSLGADLSSPGGFYSLRFFKPGQYYDGKFYRYYFKNREVFKSLRYFDNFNKKYNPNVQPQEARIVEERVEPIGEDGNYGYMFETENGIHNEAYGRAAVLDNGERAQKIEGAFSFVTPENIRVGISYVADENGYRPIITYDGINVEYLTQAQPPANVKITKIH